MSKKNKGDQNETNQNVLIGPPKLTRFERARIIGARALQISMGAPLLIETEGLTDPIDIALKELDERTAIWRNLLQSPNFLNRRMRDTEYIINLPLGRYILKYPSILALLQ